MLPCIYWFVIKIDNEYKQLIICDEDGTELYTEMLSIPCPLELVRLIVVKYFKQRKFCGTVKELKTPYSKWCETQTEQKQPQFSPKFNVGDVVQFTLDEMICISSIERIEYRKKDPKEGWVNYRVQGYSGSFNSCMLTLKEKINNDKRTTTKKISKSKS
jgi:hypothetical protein